MSGRPNILFILTDQWNPRCLGYAGDAVLETPNIDALANEGVNFERMYTPTPLCMPARASIFTGLLPHNHGVRMNGIPLSRDIPTFTEGLANSGYRVHGAGKMHLSVSNIPNGIQDHDVDPQEYPECRVLWRNRRVDSLPLPYYGFDSFDYGNGHGHHIYGQYIEWLEKNHPDSARMVREVCSTEEKTPAFKLFNRQAYKWALKAEHHPTTWTVDRCIDFLKLQKDQQKLSGVDGQPFFLYCGINDPHPPFAAPFPYCDYYKPDDIPPPIEEPADMGMLPPHYREMIETGVLCSGNPAEPMAATRPYYRECVAQYYGQIKLIDDQIGRLRHVLKESGQEENTLIVFTADHGEALGDHGLWGKGPYHYDSVIRVPCLMSWKGRIKPGSKIKTPCSLIDLAPTFLKLGESEMPGVNPVIPSEAPYVTNPLPGYNLLPYMMDEPAIKSRAVVVEMDEDYLGLRLRTLITGRYRMTTYVDKEYGELYDLKEDPRELRNLWDDPGCKELKVSLCLKLMNEINRSESWLPRQLCRS